MDLSPDIEPAQDQAQRQAGENECGSLPEMSYGKKQAHTNVH